MSYNSEKKPETVLPTAASRLGTEPVGKLMLQFSIPAITGMLVNALYIVVDRIFVGRGVGEIALGGLSLVMPLMTLTMAFGMLFGIGAAYMISMRLGQQRKNDAENALNHGFLLLVISGVILTVVEFAFFNPIFSMLGAQEGSLSLDYAKRYYRITLAGELFFIVGFGLSHCARAQGFPIISMIGNVIGAVINTILDPIFIFYLKLNVEGAALATIISQFLAVVWMIYFSRSNKAVIRLKLSSFKLSLNIIKSITLFGSSPSLLQFAIVFVQLLANYSMGWYGISALAVENGGDIAQSGMNIVGTISMLILMPVFGINQGVQPLLGFNYGAKQFKRVKNAFMLAIFAATGICISGFIVVQTIPDLIVMQFDPNCSREFLLWTPWALRIVLIFLPLNGFQIVATNMFVVTGRPKTSILLGLTRQVIALIPCMIIFGKLWGLNGVIAAFPAADCIAFVLTSFMIYFELKKMSAMREE